MKRQTNLFAQLISEQNLLQAIDEVNRTHHWKAHHRPNRCTIWVERTKQERVRELREILSNGFDPKPYKIRKIYDTGAGKERTIHEPAQYPDQYIHHALIQVLQPVFMRGMDYYCCGSIKGRGTNRARKAIQSWVRNDPQNTRYELCCDIYHFYDSLTAETVMQRMRNLIKDGKILDLIERTIQGGIAIGAYTSQWFANTVLQELDMAIRQSGLCKHYVRYMDNLTIFGTNKRKLHKLKRLIEQWLNAHNLKLKGDWQIFPVPQKTIPKSLSPPRKGVTREKGRLPQAVGYRYGRTYTLPRKKTLLRLKRALTKAQKRDNIDSHTAAGLLSRLGILRHCNNHSISTNLPRQRKLTKKLKAIVKRWQKEMLKWNMYSETLAAEKSLESKVTATQIIAGM